MNRKWYVAGSLGIAAIGITVGLFLSSRPPGRRVKPGMLSRPPIEASAADKQDFSNSDEVDIQLITTASNAELSLSWGRFRGPNGTGISSDTAIPTKWSDRENLRWKAELPGAGSSSPVLTEKYVFVTSFSGYGESAQSPGNMGQLKRHLSCIDRQSGALIWLKDFDAVQPEDPYQGMGVPEHGYATNSPVTDGEMVFAFLGKSGVFAFDLEGNQRWQVSVGTESGNRGWGSAASLMLYGDMVIVNAAEESQSIVALEKSSGKVVWKSPAATLELSYGTPAIVRVDDKRDELVLAVPGEVWGMNPVTGKLVWYAETTMTDNLSPSVIVDGDRIYAFGGYRSSGSIAMRAGGSGDVTDSHVLWTSRNSSYVATPVLLDKKLYWIDDRGVYFCADAETGEMIHKTRTPGIASGERPVYASPLAINQKLYIQTRTSGLFVVEPSSDLKVLQQNKFESDDSIFNASPAVADGQLFLRSYQYLYCIEST